MTGKTSKRTRYGDFCFREAYAGMAPQEIRRTLAARARDQISRSMRREVSFLRCDWPWLRTPA